MVDLQNFLASWQLYPENGTYEAGSRPKSGIYRIEMLGELLSIGMNWVSLEDHSFSSRYTLIPNGEEQPLADHSLADTVKIVISSGTHFETQFIKGHQIVLVVHHDITPKGLLQVTQQHFRKGEELKDVEIYHKQMSVLPYASSVGGAVIRKTEEGIIRHQALSAMDEQTNMQLNQIRQQVELLAAQAKEIQRRKELSFMIYDSKLSFVPVIGHTYHLYEQANGTSLLSMIGPNEWGRKGSPYASHISTVKMLADHTWVVVEN
jgi:Protein of unknown function (DUF2452)